MSQRVLAITLGERLSFGRILKLAQGGAIGGLITFLVFHRLLRGMPLLGTGGADAWNWGGVGIISSMAMGAVIGMTIGASLIAAEEWHTKNVNRIMRMCFTGGAVGLACGALGGLDGQFIFYYLSMLFTPVARIAGWALLGAGAGLCPGAVARSLKRAELGGYGGLVGGAVGGFLFDALAAITGSSVLSTALGLILMGAAIGIAVGFLEELVKECWLTGLTGAKEGQTFPLLKPETRLGKDETLDIPLFGDSSVQKQHARIIKSGNTVTIVAEQQGIPLVVNNQVVASAVLSNGDIIGIGKHRFRFNSRGGSPSPVNIVAPPQQAHPTTVQIIAGPHAGSVIPINSGLLSIGRSSECNVPLPADNSASRQHARLIWNGSVWNVEDCGSTNGTYVNDQRVTSQPIKTGDVITVGESSLRLQ